MVALHENRKCLYVARFFDYKKYVKKCHLIFLSWSTNVLTIRIADWDGDNNWLRRRLHLHPAITPY